MEGQLGHLKTWTKAALPTGGAPNVMHWTSEVGDCRAAQVAARVTRAPPLTVTIPSALDGCLLQA